MPGLTMKPILASRRPPISVVILGVPPVEELDLIGPLEVFAGANVVLGARGPAYDVRVVSSQPKPIIAGECGVSLLAHGYYRRLRELRGHTGRRLRTEPQKTHATAAFLFGYKGLRAAHDEWHPCASQPLSWLKRVYSITSEQQLTGPFAADLQKKYPGVKVDANPIWIQDGNIYTSAGITAGIDLALAMVEEDHGASVALDVARNLIVFLRRPGGRRRNSAFPYQRKLRDVRRCRTFRCGWQKT